MKIRTLNLLIVDDNKLISGPLSKHLHDRFGMRINISSFFDEESCMLKIDERSNVIVLDYFLNNGDNKTKNGLDIFNSIKKRSPNIEVTMITSNEAIPEAIEEMQRGASDYIIKRERYLQKMLVMLNRIVLSPVYHRVLSPIHRRVVLPIRKIIEDYTLQDYLTMFIVAFISVGTLVFFGLKIFR